MTAADETVYSSEPALRSPRRFAADARADLKVVPMSAWRLWLRGTQAQHRQSRLGYAWVLAPPLAIAFTWAYLEQAGLVSFGDVGIPYLAYALTGALLWQVFSDALLSPLERLDGARHLLGKARLPHEAWIAAGALDVVFHLLVRLVVLAIVLVVVGTPLRAAILLAPLGLASLTLLGLAIGLALAPVGLMYEDVGRALALVTGLGFFLTPTVYPWPTDLPGAWLVELNPVTSVLVTTRAWLTGAPGAVPGRLAVVTIASALLLVVAWVVYRAARPHLVARL